MIALAELGMCGMVCVDYTVGSIGGGVSCCPKGKDVPEGVASCHMPMHNKLTRSFLCVVLCCDLLDEGVDLPCR